VDASCGASNPALARPRNDGARVFNQLRLPLALVRLFDALLAGVTPADLKWRQLL
jgi:hypothetical protein